MTEIEERRRRQTIRAIVAEVFMFAVIVILVVVLSLVAMGYRLDFEKGVEHSGLVQINSIPTGAAITVDGEGVFLPTNQSRTMVSGWHEIALKREGYTGWSKTIKVTEGMMYRLSYPRLYREEREAKLVSMVLEGEQEVVRPEKAFVSPDNKVMLLRFAGSDAWRYISLNDSESKVQSVLLGGVISGESEIVEWADNNMKLLVRSVTSERTEWVLLDMRKPAESVNLTKEFGLDFDDLRLESSGKLLAISGGSLREIDIASKEISKVLVSGVENFVNMGSFVAYVAKTGRADTAAQAGSTGSVDGADEAPGRGIFTFNIGESGPVLVQKLDTDEPVLLSVSEYYGDFYLAYTVAGQFRVYAGHLPRYGDEFASKMKLKGEAQLDFVPKKLKRRGDGELIVASDAVNLAVFDAESYGVTKFIAESIPLWLTEYDFATVRDGWLTAHDFDYTNPRVLVHGVAESFPAVVSENDNYLYYFNTNRELVREEIR